MFACVCKRETERKKRKNSERDTNTFLEKHQIKETSGVEELLKDRSINREKVILTIKDITSLVLDFKSQEAAGASILEIRFQFGPL